MSNDNKTGDLEPEFELAVSSGGATSVLAGAGSIVACELSGIRRFRRVYGVSGGAIFGSIASAGLSASEVLHLVLDTQFADHVTFNDGILRALRKACKRLRGLPSGYPGKVFEQEHAEWHVSGLMGSGRLGRFIVGHLERHGVQGWPQPFCTMATTKDGSQVVFNKDGVYLNSVSGEFSQLADKPVPVEMAVRASATIPGVIAAIEYKGMMLFDGGLSRDGLCPVGLFIRNFDANPRKIIACRVGEDNLKPVSGRLHRFARWIWQVHPEFHWGPECTGVMEFRPDIEHVHSLKFALTRDEKWLAILISFEVAAARLALEGILAGDGLAKTRSIFYELGYWRDYMPAPAGSEQILANRAERVFAEHGLY